MESEKPKPTADDVKSFGFVADYVYAVGYRKGKAEGFAQGKASTTIAGRALVYSGHFVIGTLVGAIAGCLLALVIFDAMLDCNVGL